MRKRYDSLKRPLTLPLSRGRGKRGESTSLRKEILRPLGEAFCAPQVGGMNTNHTVILGTTAISISTAIQLNRNPAHHSRFPVQFNRCQNRFSKTSASSTARASCGVSHWPNGSSQVIYNRRSFGHRVNFRIVPTHQITVSSFQSSTVVLIGSTVGLRSSPQQLEGEVCKHISRSATATHIRSSA